MCSSYLTPHAVLACLLCMCNVYWGRIGAIVDVFQRFAPKRADASWLSNPGTAAAVAVLAFTVPKLYELKKDDIDNAVSTAQTHGKKHYSNYVEPYVKKIPRGSTSSTNTSSAPSGLSGADNGPSGPNNNNFSAPNSNFGGGNNTLGGNTNFGGPNSGSRPNTFESEADSFTNIGRDAAAGISSEGKKLT